MHYWDSVKKYNIYLRCKTNGPIWNIRSNTFRIALIQIVFVLHLIWIRWIFLRKRYRNATPVLHICLYVCCGYLSLLSSPVPGGSIIEFPCFARGPDNFEMVAPNTQESTIPCKTKNMGQTFGRKCPGWSQKFHNRMTVLWMKSEQIMAQ